MSTPNCDHFSPRHLIEKFGDDGLAERLWMCSTCGEVVGEYKRVRTEGMYFDGKTHTWSNGKGKVVSEYR